MRAVLAGNHPPEWYCGARKKQGPPGATCTLVAGWGTGHVGVGRCKLHGGKGAGSERAGLAAITERNFNAWLEKNGVPSSGDPVTSMTRILDRVIAWHDYIEHLVAELNIDEWEKRSRTEEGAVTIQLSVYVGLLERAQERAHKHLVDFVRLGLEERLVRITERQAEAIIAVIGGVIDDLGLDEDGRRRADESAERHLALVSRTGPAS